MTSVSDAANSGDELKLLYALRARVATEIENCPTRDLSPLTRRLQDITKDIRELEEQRRQENPGGRKKRDQRQAGWDPDESV